MALLTAAAIEDYKEFTQRNIAYSRVKVGGTYYKLGKPEIHVLTDGRIAADIVVDHTIPGTITATEFQLFNTKDQLFCAKPDSITRKDTTEGIFYRFAFKIEEG